MARASRPCPVRDCPNLKPCPIPEHAPPKAWASSTRRTRTISGSRQQRRARFVMDRDNAVCHVCGHGGADEVDHVICTAEGGADHVSNLAPIHRKPCHEAKTQAEALRASRGSADPRGVPPERF